MTLSEVLGNAILGLIAGLCLTYIFGAPVWAGIMFMGLLQFILMVQNTQEANTREIKRQLEVVLSELKPKETQ